jgi:hypothetical protein
MNGPFGLTRLLDVIEDYFIKRSSSEKPTHEADGEAEIDQ